MPGCCRTGRSPRRRCCRAPNASSIKRATGVLPSRAADNLFWVGRYVERAEATLRLVRALINRITEADETAAPLIDPHHRRCSAPGAPARATSRTAQAGPDRARRAVARRLRRLAAASRAAPRARPHRSSATASRPTPGARSNDLVRDHAIAPLPDGPVRNRDVRARRRGAAHHRVVLRPRPGEHERSSPAGASSSSAGASSARSRPAGSCASSPMRPRSTRALDVLLELCDSQITYRQRYVMVAARAPVIDLVDARSEQSALGRLSARPHRGASRGAAAPAPTGACRRRSRSRPPPRPRCAPPRPPRSTTR